MKIATIILFLQRHELSVNLVLITVTLPLLIVPLHSDIWVELRLRRVVRCSTKDPTHYELLCRKLRYTDHQVARAGLWVVCYSFPRGIVPQLYFKTKPYCAEFDEDIVSAEWLDDARLFCLLSPILAIWGLLFYTMGTFSGQTYVKQTSHVMFAFSGMSGLLGALKMVIHMNKGFLIPDRRARVQLLVRWPFYWTVVGSILMGALGLVGHVDKIKIYSRSRVTGRLKNV